MSIETKLSGEVNAETGGLILEVSDVFEIEKLHDSVPIQGYP